MLLIYIGPPEPQKFFRTSAVISSVLRILTIFFSTARTNSNLFSIDEKGTFDLLVIKSTFDLLAT